MQIGSRRLGAAAGLAVGLLLAVPGAGAGTVVEFETTLGDVRMELLDGVAPNTVANFLNYVNDGDYDFSLVHRALPGVLIQGGFLRLDGLGLVDIPTDDPIDNEFTGTSNVRGTVAMARLEGEPDSARAQWYVNRADNLPLDTLDGGFTVFGNVLGFGMEVVDLIGVQPVWNAINFFNPPVPALGMLPLVGYSGSGPLLAEQLVLVTKASVVSGPGTPPALILAALEPVAGAVQLLRYDSGSDTLEPGPNVPAGTPEGLALDARHNLYVLIDGALTRNGLPVAVPGCPDPEAIGIHPDGMRVAVGCREASGARTAHLWDPAAGTAALVLQVTPNDRPLSDIAIDVNGLVWALVQSPAVGQLYLNASPFLEQPFARPQTLTLDPAGNVWIGGTDPGQSGAYRLELLGVNSKHVFGTPVEGEVAVAVDASGAPVIAVTTGSGAGSETRLYFRDQPTRVLPGVRVRDLAVEPPGCEGADADGDGVGPCDDCTAVPNGPFQPDAGGNSQGDVDGDGFGGVCDGDFNQDDFVGGPDFDTFLQCFNQPVGVAGPPADPTCGEADMNGDAFVGGPDFDLFLQGFNQPPGPSGEAGAGAAGSGPACGLGFELAAVLVALRLGRAARRRR